MSRLTMMMIAVWGLAVAGIAADQPGPNVLFIIADDASHFGATGCPWVKTSMTAHIIVRQERWALI